MFAKQHSKKFGVLLLLSLLSTLLLAACGATATNTAAPAATTAPAAAATTAPAAAATTAPAAGATSGATGGGKLKVGLVTDIGKVDDKSFNQSAWEGVQKFAKDTGSEVKYIETTNTNDYAKNIGQFVTEKYDVIVTVGFLMADATTKAAKENPSIKFIGVDISGVDFKTGQPVAPNFYGLIFDEDKAGMLVGALAAGMSKSHKIGGVFGRKDVPAVAKFGEGYAAGAKWLDQNYSKLTGGTTTPTLVYHAPDDNAFNDPAWGSSQSKTLVQAGNDVIFGGGGKTGNGAVIGAAEAGVYVIGVDVDQYNTLQGDSPKVAPKILSSATKQITQGVYDLIIGVRDGKAKGGDNIGPVGLAPFHDTEKDIPQDLKDALKKLDAGLKDGSIKTNVKV